tara:strand:- start:8408 stop:8626 length:219 start_codon:yes stop_codon:yes gene_type:complete
MRKPLRVRGYFVPWACEEGHVVLCLECYSEEEAAEEGLGDECEIYYEKPFGLGAYCCDFCQKKLLPPEEAGA